MAKIDIPQLNKTFEPDDSLSLMDNLLKQNIPVASSCGGDGICGKCIVELDTNEAPPIEELEKKTLEKNQAGKNQRLSCQIKIVTPSQVKTTYW